MSIADVGARLVLTGQAEFVAGMKEATDSVTDFSAAQAKAATAATAASAKISAANDKITTSQAAAADATKASTDAQTEHAAVAADAAAVTSTQAKTTDDATAATKKATTAVKEHESALTALANNSVIKKTALIGGGALAAGAYESIKQYNSLNKAITQSAVDAGVAKKNLPQVTSGILNISKETGVNAKDVADQFYRIASASNGLHKTNAEVMSLTKNAADLAVLGNVAPGSQTEQVGRIFGAMLTANLPGAQTPKQIDALVNSAVGHGDIRVGDMIGAIGKFLPAAKSVGASAPDMLGWVDMLTKQGMQGSNAGTLVNHSIQQLAHPTEQGANAEMMAGIAPGTLENLVKTKGVPAAISYLGNAVKNWNPLSYYPTNSIGGNGANAPGEASAEAQFQAWGLATPANMAKYFSGQKLSASAQSAITGGLFAKIFGNAKSATPALALLNNPQEYAGLVASIKAGATNANFQNSLNTAMQTPGRRMDIAAANIKTAGYSIGQDLTPAATDFLSALGKIADWFSSHTGALKVLVGTLAGTAGAATLVVGVSKLAKLAHDLNNLPQSVMNIFKGTTSASSLTGAATALDGSAEALTAAAEKLGTAGVGGGLGGTAAEDVEGAAGAEAGAAAGAEGAGAGAVEGAAAGEGASGALTLTSIVGAAAAPVGAAIGVAAAVALAGWLGKKSNQNNTNILGLITGASGNVNGTPFVSPAQVLKALNTPVHHKNPEKNKFGLTTNPKYQPITTPGKNPKALYGSADSNWAGLWHAIFGGGGAPAKKPVVKGPPMRPTIMSPGKMFAAPAAQSSSTASNQAYQALVKGGQDMMNAAQKHTTAAQRLIDSANLTKSANTVNKDAANDQKTASNDAKDAANLQKQASTQGTQAAQQSRQAAQQDLAAAKAHQQAAAALSKAAGALNEAATKIGTNPVNVSISGAQVASVVAGANASKAARS